MVEAVGQRDFIKKPTERDRMAAVAHGDVVWPKDHAPRTATIVPLGRSTGTAAAEAAAARAGIRTVKQYEAAAKRCNELTGPKLVKYLTQIDIREREVYLIAEAAGQARKSVLDKFPSVRGNTQRMYAKLVEEVASPDEVQVGDTE